MRNNTLEKDLKGFLDIYPNFLYKERPKKQCCLIEGEIDICDVNGRYWSSFKIAIYVDKQTYPFCVPFVLEKSKKIERHEDWHISKKGFCCLDIDHELEYAAKRGINIITFYQNMIYPFFTNSLYKMKNGNYASGEYQHSFEGVVQFYSEKWGLKDVSIIIKMLNAVSKNEIPGRNQFCLCGKNVKIKNCHLHLIEFLKCLSKERVMKDLEGFNAMRKLNEELSL